MKSLLFVLSAICAATVSRAVDFDSAKDSDVRIVYEGQMPKLRVDGCRVEPWLAKGGGLNETGDLGKIDEAFKKLYDRGFRLFEICSHTTDWYRDERTYDFSGFGKRVERILSYAPDAFVVLNLRATFEGWCRKHPDEAIVYTRKPKKPDDRSEHTGCPLRPSSASRLFRDEWCASIRAFGAYVRSQPWSKRVVAVRPCWGTYTEWHTFGIQNGPDASRPMTRAFREYLARQGRPDWTAEVPDGESRIRKGRTLLDPVRDVRLIDFFNCNAENVADLLVEVCRTVKEVLPGRLAGAYYGYAMTGHETEGQNCLLDRVLSSPFVDFLSDPSEYYTWNRLPGGCFLHRTILSPFHRYRKMSFIEDDSRFYTLMSDPGRKDCYVIPTKEGSVAVIKRNFLNCLFDGCAYQYNNPSARADKTYWLDDPFVLAGLDEAMRVYRTAGPVPVESGNETVCVMDPRANYRVDGRGASSPFLVRMWRSMDRFHSTGAGVDMMSFEDYLVAKRNWKRAIFLNLFHASDSERERLSQRVAEVERIAYFSAPERSFCDEFFAKRPGALCVKEVPDSPEDARRLLATLGERFYTSAGTCFRHHGRLSMLHSGAAGEWRISLSDDSAATVRELFSGKEYPAKAFTVSADAPETWLFKLVDRQ